MNQLTPAQISIHRLIEIIAHLRSPDGCPWDRAQTKESLKPYLLEETYEVLDAIDGNDPAELCAELGDLLLQVVLLSALHQESDQFDFADVCQGISEKLVRRHPHVFSQPGQELSPSQLDRQWQQIKDEERGKNPKPPQPALQALPSLILAQTTPNTDSRSQLNDEVELKIRMEEYLRARESAPVATVETALADLLLSLVKSVAPLKINAELALRRRIFQRKKSSQNEKS